MFLSVGCTLLHERQWKDGNPSLVANFRGIPKTGSGNSWAFRATHPPAPPHSGLGTVILAACTVLGQSEGCVSLRGSLLQHSRLPDGRQGPQRGGSSQAQAWGIMHPPTLPQTPTTGGGLRGHPPHPRSLEPGAAVPQPALPRTTKEMF